jgi:orotate phosphoribosyltransferase
MSQPAPMPAPFELHDEIVGELAALLVGRQAITFGKFRLRSSRPSPYILQVDRLCSGQDAFTVGRAMAQTVRYYFGDEVDVLFGPPYKGAPVAVLGANYYSLLVGRDTDWAFNRKEPKEYAEGGVTVGGRLGPERNVVIVDDMLVEGQDIRDAISLVKLTGANVRGVVTLVDRCERSKGKYFSVGIEQDTGVPVRTCAAITELIRRIDPVGLPPDQRAILAKYLSDA